MHLRFNLARGPSVGPGPPRPVISIHFFLQMRAFLLRLPFRVGRVPSIPTLVRARGWVCHQLLRRRAKGNELKGKLIRDERWDKRGRQRCKVAVLMDQPPRKEAGSTINRLERYLP